MSDQIPSNLTMKHVLYLITTTIALAFGTMTPAAAQQSRTLKTEMEAIHESLGVNFVYDSDINIDVPYSGKPMKLHNSDQASLELCLQTLFAGTGIDYEIMRKYIIIPYSLRSSGIRSASQGLRHILPEKVRLRRQDMNI